MKNILKIGFISLFVILFSSFTKPASINYFEGTLEEGLALAQKENKYVIVAFYAEWCDYCKAMEEKVYTNADIINTLNKDFIVFKVNGEQPQKGFETLASELESFPSIYALDQNGQQVDKVLGYTEVEDLLEFISIKRLDAYVVYKEKAEIDFPKVLALFCTMYDTVTITQDPNQSTTASLVASLKQAETALDNFQIAAADYGHVLHFKYSELQETAKKQCPEAWDLFKVSSAIRDSGLLDDD